MIFFEQLFSFDVSFIFLAAFFLCWGSFLHAIGSRIVAEQHPLAGRSKCSSCRTTLKWFELIPVFSFLFLRGKCRTCKATIPWSYIAFELLTLVVLASIWRLHYQWFWPGYFTVLSFLLISVKTDLEALVVPMATTYYAIPVIWFFAYCHWIPILFNESLVASALAYSFMWLVGYVFYKRTGQVGLGSGDHAVLAMIAGTVGLIYGWIAMTIGTIIASLVGIILAYSQGSGTARGIKIPYVPFLALGLWVTLLAQPQIDALLNKLVFF